jgi:hypothetical protein
VPDKSAQFFAVQTFNRFPVGKAGNIDCRMQSNCQLDPKTQWRRIRCFEMWPVRYLFYRLYRWQVSFWKDDKVSINALVLVVVLVCLNLIALLGLAESITA